MLLIKIVTILVCLILIAVPIWLVNNTQFFGTSLKCRELVTFWNGVILVALGLAASLWIPHELFQELSSAGQSYLSNTFLIVAAIGANFIASAALMNSRGNPNQ